MIREATRDDVPVLVTMGRRFLATVYPGQLRDDPTQLAAFTEQLLAGDASVIFVADEAETGVIGMIGMMVYPHPLSGERVATELFWWMDPDARGVLGIRLLYAAERWARDQQAVLLQMIAPDARVGEFYRRLGFTAVETTWLRRLADAPVPAPDAPFVGAST